jgi:hypothetical protein
MIQLSKISMVFVHFASDWVLFAFFFLMKKAGQLQLDLTRTNCMKKAKIAYKVAATSKENSPCSNMPVDCPICPSSSPATWKYNLKQHLTVAHPESSPDNFRNLWWIGESEKVGMKLQWSCIMHHKRKKGEKTYSCKIRGPYFAYGYAVC